MTKLCECGCGNQSPIATLNNARLGMKRGEPLRFVSGHNRKGTGKDLMDRVAEKYIPVPESGCWLWTDWVDKIGYGRMYVKGTMRGAHRVVYELYRGPIPEGLSLDHLCRVPGCVNPDHLEVVTHQDNVLRGIGPTASNAKKTHCVHGHEFTVVNTLQQSGGGRECRTCHYRRNVESRARKQEACTPTEG